MCFAVFRTLFRTKDHSQRPPATEHLIQLNVQPTPPQRQPPGHDGEGHTVPEGPLDVNNSEWKTTAWNTAKVALSFVRESADAFAPLKSVAGGLFELINKFEQTASNKDSILSVVRRIQNLNESIVKRGIPQDLGETGRRKRLESDLNNIAVQLHRMLEGNIAKRFVNNVEDAQTITGLVEDIRDTLMDYQISLQQDIYSMNSQHIASDHRNTLEKLSRAKYASHRSGDRQLCMTGTRVELLQEIEEWATSRTALPIYWLNGAAGTGKTTISQTLANRFFADEQLGASFFFSRDYEDQSNIKLVFPTLAFQLAYQFPGFQARLVDVIDHNPDVGQMSLVEQLTCLLIRPLQSLVGTTVATSPAIIVVIDALDECDDPEPESKFLSLLSQYIAEIPFVKFFITSRPEYGIRNIFNSPLKYHTRTLILQDIDPATVDRDIRKYLSARLSAIAGRSDVDITAPWPSSNDMDVLVRQCAGLFIYASTITNFIESLLDDPRTRLQQIMNTPDRDVEGVKPNNHLYFGQVRLVVACILFVFNPLPLQTLAALLNIRPGDITRILRPLHSVLLVPNDILKPIRRFHKSFPDFLADPKRCEDRNFHIDPPIYHGKIVIHCLNLMKESLKKNICSIPRYAMNADVDDLPGRRKERIGDAVEYACIFWTDHLSLASRNGEDANLILKSLKEFFEDRFLLWIEVCSVTEKLGVAVYSIHRVQEWILDTRIPDMGLQELIYDCERFVLQFFDVIRESASHIYHSSLPFLPTSSQLRKRHRDQIVKEVKIPVGVDTSWNACIRRIHNSGITYCVTISPNGILIASNSGGVVEILDAITGVRQATLEGHWGDVRSIVFSPDGMLLVSGSNDRTLKIWDIQTGGLIRTLEGHLDWIYSVSFSPNGRMIASGSKDHDIRIWNPSSGECIAVLACHSEVCSVCWSGNTAVVFGHGDNSVRLWDIPTKTCFKLDTHTNVGVTSSADGTKIASAWNKHIYVHDIQTGVIKTFSNGSAVLSSCLSPKGDQILYGSDTHLYIRNISLDESPSIIVGQTSASYICSLADVTSIASIDHSGVKIWKNWDSQTIHEGSASILDVCFSADGRLAASASSDKIIKVWDVATGTCLHTMHAGYHITLSISVSSDGSLVAWGSFGEVTIWNVHTNQLVHSIKGHQMFVERIRFSSDGRQIVSVSRESMVVLDTKTGAITATVQSNFLYVQWIRFSEDGSIVLRMGAITERWKLAPASISTPSPPPNSGENDGRTPGTSFSTVPPISSRIGLDSTKFDSPPFILVSSPEDYPTSTSPFSHLEQYHMEDGWILDQKGRRVSHVPEAKSFDFHDQEVIVGTEAGSVVIMDWSNTSTVMLRG